MKLVSREVRDPVAGHEAPGPEGSAQASGAIVNLGKRESVLSTDDSSRVGLSQSRIVHQVYVALDRCRHGLSGQEGASFNSHVPAQDRCNFR